MEEALRLLSVDGTGSTVPPTSTSHLPSPFSNGLGPAADAADNFFARFSASSPAALLGADPAPSAILSAALSATSSSASLAVVSSAPQAALPPLVGDLSVFPLASVASAAPAAVSPASAAVDPALAASSVIPSVPGVPPSGPSAPSHGSAAPAAPSFISSTSSALGRGSAASAAISPAPAASTAIPSAPDVLPSGPSAPSRDSAASASLGSIFPAPSALSHDSAALAAVNPALATPAAIAVAPSSVPSAPSASGHVPAVPVPLAAAIRSFSATSTASSLVPSAPGLSSHVFAFPTAFLPDPAVPSASSFNPAALTAAGVVPAPPFPRPAASMAQPSAPQRTPAVSLELLSPPPGFLSSQGTSPSSQAHSQSFLTAGSQLSTPSDALMASQPSQRLSPPAGLFAGPPIATSSPATAASSATITSSSTPSVFVASQHLQHPSPSVRTTGGGVGGGGAPSCAPEFLATATHTPTHSLASFEQAGTVRLSGSHQSPAPSGPPPPSPTTQGTNPHSLASHRTEGPHQLQPPLRPGAAEGRNGERAQGAASGGLHPGDSAAMEEQVLTSVSGLPAPPRVSASVHELPAATPAAPQVSASVHELPAATPAAPQVSSSVHGLPAATPAAPQVSASVYGLPAATPAAWPHFPLQLSALPVPNASLPELSALPAPAPAVSSPPQQPAMIFHGNGSWRIASPATTAQLTADAAAATSQTPIVWQAPPPAAFPPGALPAPPPFTFSPVNLPVTAKALPAAPAFPPSTASLGPGVFTSFSSLPTLPRPGNDGKRVHAAVQPFTPAINPFPNPFATPPSSSGHPSTPRFEQSHVVTPSVLFAGPRAEAEGSNHTSFHESPAAFAPSDGSSGSFVSASSPFTSSVASGRMTPVTRPLPSSPSSMLHRARGVRQVYSEGPTRRSDGVRIIAPDGTDAEFSAPFRLALEIDQHLQSRILEACGAIDPQGAPSRSGVPEEMFESVWESSALELSEVVATAVGCSRDEASGVIAQNNGDCSISLLSMLHDRGDPFQKQCAHASAVELKRRRQDRSLKIIVEDAAKQGRLPNDIASKRMLRTLQQHLPLNEIMGHRYRTPTALKPSGGRQRVSFEGDDDDLSDEQEEEEYESDGGKSNSSRHSRFGASDDDASSWEGADSNSDGDSSEDSLSSFDDDEEEDDEPSTPSRRKRSRSNLMAAPPPNWTDGDPPNGGFYLDTFTKIYQSYRSFTALHGKSLSFKSLIEYDIEKTLMMELGIRRVKTYKKMSDEQLIKRIKKHLGFHEEDYYARKLELLRFPKCNQAVASSLYRSFRKLTTPFLKILGEAEDSGARLRKSNVSRIFKNQIRGYPALERWFLSKRFKTFNDAVRHISKEIHSRMATEIESQHDEMISNGQVAGARTDVRGGKAEPGKAKVMGGGFQFRTRINKASVVTAMLVTSAAAPTTAVRRIHAATDASPHAPPRKRKFSERLLLRKRNSLKECFITLEALSARRTHAVRNFVKAATIMRAPTVRAIFAPTADARAIPILSKLGTSMTSGLTARVL
jgi:hypothetical protein